MTTLSILIVDDNLAARSLLKSVLSGLGLRIKSYDASSGTEAIELSKMMVYDIIFLDIEMPGMNGLETLEKILQQRQDQFVVIVSANATIENVKKAIALGGQGFIVKPYKSTKVNAAIEKYLAKQK